MASEDLLKKAVAAFNALSPEQQAEMLEEQRQSWVRGNIGLSQDERGMTSPAMPRLKPAATDTVSKDDYKSDGLETVAWQDFVPSTGWVASSPSSIAKDKRELVTRSQAESEIRKVREDAEELLAAERADHDNTIATLSSLIEDNAAQAARIKELEDYFSKCISNETFLEQDARRVRQIEALEAKLAAAETALEPFVSFFNEAMKGFTEGYAERTPPDKPVLGWNNAYLLMRHFIEARAVLGGKPSC